MKFLVITPVAGLGKGGKPAAEGSVVELADADAAALQACGAVAPMTAAPEPKQELVKASPPAPEPVPEPVAAPAPATPAPAPKK